MKYPASVQEIVSAPSTRSFRANGTAIQDRMTLNGGTSGAPTASMIARYSPATRSSDRTSPMMTGSPRVNAAIIVGATENGTRVPICALTPVMERASANSNQSSVNSTMEAPVCSVIALS